MSILKKAVASLALTWTISAQALGVPWLYRPQQILTCPAVGTSYSQMLNNLETLKNSIREGANCANATIKINDASKLNQDMRAEFLALIEKSKTEPLTNDEGKRIATYVENITENVATLVDLFTNSNHCFSDDKNAADKIAGLVGFVNEASRLVGSVAGPWGAPIAIGGRVVAGLLAGINEIMKSRVGFDFNTPKGWRGYVDNLCTYYNFREEIGNLLNPEQKAKQLTQLAANLDQHIASMTDRCDGCKKVVSMFNQNAKLDPTLVIDITEPLVNQLDAAYQKPIGSYTLQASGLKQWALAERDRVLKESEEFMQDTSGKYLLFKAKQDLDSFLIVRQAPKFLNFQIRDAMARWQQFREFLRNEGPSLYQAVIDIAPELNAYPDSWVHPNTEEIFDFLINKEIPWEKISQKSGVNQQQVADVRDAVGSFQIDIRTMLDFYKTTIGAYRTFCQFFRLSGNYNSGIRDACSSNTYAHLLDQQSRFIPDEIKDEHAFSTSVIQAIENTILEIGSEPNLVVPRT